MSSDIIDPTKNFVPRTNPPKADSGLMKTQLQPRSMQEAKDAASLRTDIAIEALEAIVRNPSAKDSDRINAANSLLDRAHGRVSNQLPVDDDGKLVIQIVQFKGLYDNDKNIIEQIESVNPRGK